MADETQIPTPTPTAPDPEATPTGQQTPSSDTTSDQSQTPSAPAQQPSQAQTPAQAQPNAPAQPQAPAQPTTQAQQPPPPPPAPKGVSPDDPNASHPSVQRAGVLNTIAQALAGGPRYKTSIDPNTGTTTRTEVPMSKGSIGLAIALEALGGALGGLSAKPGPGNLGRAAGAGYAQVEGEEQQAKAQQDQQATADYTRQAQAFENNLRVRQLAMTVGKMDSDSHDQLVKDAAPIIDSIKTDSPDMIAAERVSEDQAQDVKKYPITEYQRWADGKVPRLDSNGHQVFVNSAGRVVPEGTPGSFAASDNTYTIIDKNAKVSTHDANGNIQPWIQDSVKYGLLPASWLNAANTQMPASGVGKYRHQATSLDLFQNDLNTFHQVTGLDSPDLAAAVKQDQSLANAAVKFEALRNATNHNIGQSLDELRKTDPASANKITSLYGGNDAIQKFDARQKAIDSAQNVANSPIKNRDEAISRSLNPDPAISGPAKQWLKVNQDDTIATAAGKDKEAAKYKHGTGDGTGIETGPSKVAAALPPVNGVREDYINSLPPEEAALVRAVGEGRVELANSTIRTKEGKKLSAEVATAYPPSEGHPGYDASRYPTYAATRKSFGANGKDADTIAAITTGMSHLKTMYDNASWGSTTPGVNEVASAFGNQSVVNYKEAQSLLADEEAKIYKTSAMTDQDKKQFDELLSAKTPAEAKAKIRSLVTLLGGKLGSLQQKWKNGSPPGAVQEIPVMSDEARDIYQSLTGKELSTGGQQSQPARQQQQQQQQYSVTTKDGKMGWDGQKWNPIPQQQPGSFRTPTGQTLTHGQQVKHPNGQVGTVTGQHPDTGKAIVDWGSGGQQSS